MFEQTVQTQIRLLLRSSLIRVYIDCYFSALLKRIPGGSAERTHKCTPPDTEIRPSFKRS